MSKCTKGKLEVWSHIGRGWAVQVICEDGKDALSGRDFEEAQANAKELVRRWNAFEDGGLVEELKDALKKYGDHLGCCYKNLTMGDCNCGLEAALAKS